MTNRASTLIHAASRLLPVGSHPITKRLVSKAGDLKFTQLGPHLYIADAPGALEDLGADAFYTVRAIQKLYRQDPLRVWQAEESDTRTILTSAVSCLDAMEACDARYQARKRHRQATMLA